MDHRREPRRRLAGAVPVDNDCTLKDHTPGRGRVGAPAAQTSSFASPRRVVILAATIGGGQLITWTAAWRAPAEWAAGVLQWVLTMTGEVPERHGEILRWGSTAITVAPQCGYLSLVMFVGCVASCMRGSVRVRLLAVVVAVPVVFAMNVARLLVVVIGLDHGVPWLWCHDAVNLGVWLATAAIVIGAWSSREVVRGCPAPRDVLAKRDGS